MIRSALLCALTGALVVSACATAPISGDPTVSVTAFAETARVMSEGDAADDPAIWAAPNPADSLVLGTDKKAGLYVYGLDGTVRQFLPVGRVNNVDLRDGFSFAGEDRVLVVASDRTNIALATFLLHPATGHVVAAPNGLIPLDVDDPYGVCLSRTAEGAFRAAVTSRIGELREFELRDGGGAMEAVELRRFDVGSIAEGCVYDDRTGALYVAEENVGIWRYAAQGDARTLVHAIDDAALVADIEGLSIYPAGADAGWLLASSQGDNAYAVFALPEGRYVGRIRVADGALTDGTTETDGLDVVSQPVGEHSAGLLVVQDDADDAGGQNFKFVDWREVAAALELE